MRQNAAVSVQDAVRIASEYGCGIGGCPSAVLIKIFGD